MCVCVCVCVCVCTFTLYVSVAVNTVTCILLSLFLHSNLCPLKLCMTIFYKDIYFHCKRNITDC